MTREQEAAIEQLSDSKAPKRLSAANTLGRKPCPQEAGPKLSEAFKAELQNAAPVQPDRVARLGELSL